MDLRCIGQQGHHHNGDQAGPPNDRTKKAILISVDQFDQRSLICFLGESCTIVYYITSEPANVP